MSDGAVHARPEPAAQSAAALATGAGSTVGDLTERALIARVHAHVAASTRPPWLVVGIGDDAAVVQPERNHLDVLTVDAVVEGVHFDRRFCPPQAIGHRALAVNLSDLAAMGAAPRMALLSMALPSTLALADVDGILEGLSSLARRHNVTVAGGNLTRSPGPLMIDVTAIGTLRRRQILTRRGARVGDEVYVTGTLGAAAAGLEYLQAGVEARPDDERSGSVLPDGAIARYLYPDARVRAGTLAARSRSASACMDLSDGLVDALSQVAEQSGVRLAIEASRLPIDADARTWWTSRHDDVVARAAAGGDDYELLFTVAPRRRRAFLAALTHSGTAVTRIGSCERGEGVHIDGVSAPLTGFRHFR